MKAFLSWAALGILVAFAVVWLFFFEAKSNNASVGSYSWRWGIPIGPITFGLLVCIALSLLIVRICIWCQ